MSVSRMLTAYISVSSKIVITASSQRRDSERERESVRVRENEREMTTCLGTAQPRELDTQV